MFWGEGTVEAKQSSKSQMFISKGKSLKKDRLYGNVCITREAQRMVNNNRKEVSLFRYCKKEKVGLRKEGRWVRR